MPSAGEKQEKPSHPHLDEEQVKTLAKIKNQVASIKQEAAAAGRPIDPDLIDRLEKEIALLESWID